MVNIMSNVLTSPTPKLSSAVVIGGAVGGGALLGGLITSALMKKSNSKKRKKKRTTPKKRKGRYTPHTAGKRKDTSHKRIRYTKNGQPYIIMGSGKAKFIKKKGAKKSHKLKGGRY